MLFVPSKLHRFNPSSPVTNVPFSQRQRLKDDYLPMFLKFLSLPVGIASRTLFIGLYPGPLVSLLSCVIHYTTAGDKMIESVC